MTSPKPAHETMPNWPPSSWNGGRDQIVIGGRLRWNPHAQQGRAVIGPARVAPALKTPPVARAESL
jgi:hypothetical protein